MKLEDVGIAAGTDTSTVDLFKFSAVSPDGLDEMYTTSQTSGDVLLLLKLDGGGLAAFADSSTVDLFNCFSAVSPNGLNVITRQCKRLALSFYC